MELIILFIFIFIYINIKKDFKKKIKNNSNKKYNMNSKQNYSNQTKKEETMNTTKIAEHFNISARELNKIFEELQWIYKKDRWWLATEIGEERGAKELYDIKRKIKYIKWNPNIKNNSELINKIYNKKHKQNENIKQQTKKKEKQSNYHVEMPTVEQEETKYKNTPKMTNKEKKGKGDKYEEYIAKFFREQGYYVWEHGKEKGMLDSSIDLFIKKDNYIFFVQCKNWDKWKINHKEVKATRTDVRDYLQKEKILWELIKDYQSKILYVTPRECLTRSAYTYIKENQELVEYQVIPIIK